MLDFIIKKLPSDLTATAGMALVGQYAKRLGISALVDRKSPVAAGGIPNSGILKSHLSLLVQGMNDFYAIADSCSIARNQPHVVKCCMGLGPPNAVGPHSLSGRSCSVASGLSGLIAQARLERTSTSSTPLARQEACNLRRTFCRPRPTAARVSTLLQQTLYAHCSGQLGMARYHALEA